MVLGKQNHQTSFDYAEIRTLSIHIDSATNFDTEEELVGCSSTPGIFFHCRFNGDILRSRIVPFPTRAGKHRLVWKDTLQWQFRKKQLTTLKRSGNSIKLRATLVKDWNPKHKNPEKFFKDESFHTELGFVVFPIKTAESHAKRPDGPPLEWYKIRHVPSWFKLGPSVRLQIYIQEDELWTPEMLENKQKEKEKKKRQSAKKGVAKTVNNVNNKKLKRNKNSGTKEEEKEKIIQKIKKEESEGEKKKKIVTTNTQQQNTEKEATTTTTTAEVNEQEKQITKDDERDAFVFSIDTLKQMNLDNNDKRNRESQSDNYSDDSFHSSENNFVINQNLLRTNSHGCSSEGARKSIEIQIPFPEHVPSEYGEENDPKKALVHNDPHCIPELSLLPQAEYMRPKSTPPVNTPKLLPQNYAKLASISPKKKNAVGIKPTQMPKNRSSYPMTIHDLKSSLEKNSRPLYNNTHNSTTAINKMKNQNNSNNNNNNNDNSISNKNMTTNNVTTSTNNTNANVGPFSNHNLSSTSSNFPPSGPIHEICHEYRISIEIKSVKNMLQKNKIYFKYLYPLFGCLTPFQTNLIEINEQSLETNIGGGYCNFQFQMKPSRLHASFHKKPLLIQCFVRSESGGDRERGLCLVDLEQILQKSNYKSNHTQGSQCGFFDNWLPILDEDGFQGEARICIKIENHGLKPTSRAQSGSYEDALSFHSLWEIELWKKKQKRKFEERWKSFETEEIENLKSNYSMKEKKLEEKYEKKHEKLVRLEKKLKSSLFEIEKQEKTLKLEELRKLCK